MEHVLKIDEGDRQLVLMALAHLSIERPGFDDALQRMAAQIDNQTAAGRPELYDNFRALRADYVTWIQNLSPKA
jgi:hypothetical protein